MHKYGRQQKHCSSSAGATYFSRSAVKRHMKLGGKLITFMIKAKIVDSYDSLQMDSFASRICQQIQHFSRISSKCDSKHPADIESIVWMLITLTVTLDTFYFVHLTFLHKMLL